MGFMYCNQCLWDRAIRAFNDSLSIQINQQNPDAGEIAAVLYKIAAVYLEVGDTGKAIDFYEETLLYHNYNAPNKKMNDLVVRTLQCLAQLYQLNGDLDIALKRYKEAIEYSLKNSDKETSSQVVRLLYSNVGDIYIEKGDVDKAMEAYAMALRLNRLAGIDEDFVVTLTDGLAMYEVLREQGEAAPAA